MGRLEDGMKVVTFDVDDPPCYAINRRRVVDQTLYVRARSMKDALRKARTQEDIIDASDETTTKITLRPIAALEASRTTSEETE
jgi:hypothetical protein